MRVRQLTNYKSLGSDASVTGTAARHANFIAEWLSKRVVSQLSFRNGAKHVCFGTSTIDLPELKVARQVKDRSNL